MNEPKDFSEFADQAWPFGEIHKLRSRPGVGLKDNSRVMLHFRLEVVSEV